jgi:hypothetical protein
LRRGLYGGNQSPQKPACFKIKKKKSLVFPLNSDFVYTELPDPKEYIFWLYHWDDKQERERHARNVDDILVKLEEV